MKRRPGMILPVLAALLITGCGHGGLSATMEGGRPPTAAAASQSGAPLLPDPHLTPGATLDVTVQDISVPGYTKKVRDVPLSVKRQVYAEYGIASHKPGEYEVDHLISLELGGSNSLKNLWPQSYLTEPWNAHVKDDLENKLHDLVCSGQVPLATAQHAIAANWIAAYKTYFHTSAPLPSGGFSRYAHSRAARRRSRSSSPAGYPPTPPSPSGGEVWVNTRSGKYFLPGSRYYGHTKEGQYMTAQQAQQQGDVPAHGR